MGNKSEVKFTFRIQSETLELAKREAKRRSLSLAAFLKNALWRELQTVQKR